MRNSTKELIERYEERVALMKLENGVTEFERKDGFNTEWFDCIDPTSPVWSPSIYCDFRVKHKPVEGWVWKYKSNTLGALAYMYNQKQPDDTIEYGRVMVLMREVTE